MAPLAFVLAAATSSLLAGCDEESVSNDPDAGVAAGGIISDAAGPRSPRVALRPRDYIRSDSFPSLLIEVDHAKGLAPRAGVEDAVGDTLAELLDKPGGIHIRADGEVPASDDGVWSLEELAALVSNHYDKKPEANALSIYTLWLDGQYADPNVLGVAWANQYIALFAERIARMCTVALAPLEESFCRAAEHAVWSHELGHVIGLVDNGIPLQSQHADPAHEAHDRDESCIMHYAYEGEGLVDVLLPMVAEDESALAEFDAACKQDVVAVRD